MENVIRLEIPTNFEPIHDEGRADRLWELANQKVGEGYAILPPVVIHRSGKEFALVVLVRYPKEIDNG